MRESILTPQADVGLGPLAASHEADQIEADLKALFMSMYDTYVRASERALNTAGIPHVGINDQFERAVKNDGLSVLRNANNTSIRYLYKAWKARNPRRGLHILRLYLQLIWPNGFELHQLWHDPAVTYPAGLSEVSQAGYYLTSRLRIYVTALDVSVDVGNIARALRSVLPAKFVLDVQLLSRSTADMGICVGMSHQLFHQIEGTFE